MMNYSWVNGSGMWSGYFPESYQHAFFGGAVGAFLVAFIVLAVLVGIALYVYQAWAWMRIAKKRKYKHPWLAWIPFAASAMRLEMGGFHWAWVFLFLIPIFGWIAVLVLLTISMWRIFEKQKYAGWLALSYPLMVIPHIMIVGIAYFVVIGMIAWKKR